MPKKTLRRPYKPPPPRICRECGKEVRRRDITAGRAKQLDAETFICPFCVSNVDVVAPLRDTTPPGTPALKEVKDVQQAPGEPFRRWYTNGPVELIVWLDDYRILGFQLVVPSGHDQTAITWHKGAGLSVADIDDGEGRPMRSKMTPVLLPGGDFDMAAALALFRTVSDGLPNGLAAVVERELSEAAKKRNGDRDREPHR